MCNAFVSAAVDEVAPLIDRNLPSLQSGYAKRRAMAAWRFSFSRKNR
jgi:hypothetical protein